MTDPLSRLHAAATLIAADGMSDRPTARLLRAGPPKIAKKLVEEAAELAIETVAGQRERMVSESADLLYHLTVLWADAGIEPREVWREMERREAMFGLAEKPGKRRRGERRATLVPGDGGTETEAPAEM